MTDPLPRQFQLMAAYNEWMNTTIYQAAAKLSDEARKADRGAFFRSIHGTLNHLMFGDMIWFGRFINRPGNYPRHDMTIHENFDELWAARKVLDQEISTWAQNLTAAWLDAPFAYTNMAGEANKRPAWILVTQMFNHQTHHRGQITTLLMQAGIDPGITDLPYLPSLPLFEKL